MICGAAGRRHLSTSAAEKLSLGFANEARGSDNLWMRSVLPSPQVYS